MKKYLSSLFLTILLMTFYLSGQSQNLTRQTGQHMAGISKIDITPDFPVKLYGYSSRTSLSEGVHDPLSARAVVFENNQNKFVLLSSDLGSYGREALDVIRKSLIDRFGLKDSELFLTAIHSHSSPVLTLNKETGDPANIRYTEALNEKLLTLVGEAFNNLTPVQAGVGTGSSPVGSNRREMRPDGSITLGRNPYGPTDKEVLVLKVEKPGGVPVAGIFDYATHATALGPRNLMISGDVLGISSQFVEKILGDEFVAPVFAGASGNIDPWYRVLPGFDTEPGWIPEPVLLGTLLGEEIVHVFRTISETGSDLDISTAFQTIELPRRENAENKNSGEKGQESKVPVNIIAAKLGSDIAFVGISVEMLTELGMMIKSGSPFRHTFVITHCNGASGYLPPAGLYKEGGYEITSTPFAIGSGEMVVKKALRMLYDLK